MAVLSDVFACSVSHFSAVSRHHSVVVGHLLNQCEVAYKRPLMWLLHDLSLVTIADMLRAITPLI